MRRIAPHGDPILFLLIRFLIVVAVFAMLARKAEWPKGGQLAGHLLAGMVINGVYLIASFWAVANGLAAGVMTLLGALQPLFVALVTVIVLRAPIGLRAWMGLMLGLAGVALVLSPRLSNVDVAGLPALPVAFGLLGILALTAGTMVQKSSLAAADLRVMGAVQHLGAAMVAGVALLTLGTGRWDGTQSLWLAMAWSVIALSLAGTSLYIWMVRRGEVTRVTALALLVPPATALQAWLLFGERLSTVQLVGFAITLAGVAIVQRFRVSRYSVVRQPQKGTATDRFTGPQFDLF